jgi:predicted Zn-dependent protease
MAHLLWLKAFGASVVTLRRVTFLAVFIFFIMGWFIPIGGSTGARGMSLIRDTEIENTIRNYAAPILRVASLEDEAFNIHVVRSNELNAFVARGQRLFVTTGLMRRSGDANQLIGVIAHEIGHISGGHLARTHAALEQASKTAWITQIIGLAAGILAGSPGAGIAAASGGQHVAERSFLNYSRGQEQAADQAGVTFLDRAGLSSKGMLNFLSILSNQELLHSSRQDPYVLTHPLTQGRIAFVRRHVRNSRYSERPTSSRFAKMHRRLVAKLDGYLDPPGTTLRKYKDSDQSIPARYARAIAHFRQADLDRAVPLLSGLISQEPLNPYFHELNGQMMFENGRMEAALKSYQESIRLLPNAPLLRTALAHVEIEMNRPELIDDALIHTKAALRQDRFISLAWRLKGVAHGRKGQLGLSAISLAEYNLLIGRKSQAKTLAQRALKLLKQGEPAWLHAQDIIHQIDRKS